VDTRDCSNGRLGQWPHQQERRGDGRQVAPCRVTSESPRERSVYNTQIDTRTARPTPQPNGFRPANERRDEQTAPRLPFATISFFSLLYAVMDVQSRQLRIGHIPDPRRREFHGWSGFRRYTPISPFVRSFTSLLAFVSFRYAGISSSAAGAGEASCGGRMVVQKVGSCAPIITIWLSVPPSSFRPIPSDRMLLTFIFVL